MEYAITFVELDAGGLLSMLFEGRIAIAMMVIHVSRDLTNQKLPLSAAQRLERCHRPAPSYWRLRGIEEPPPLRYHPSRSSLMLLRSPNTPPRAVYSSRLNPKSQHSRAFASGRPNHSPLKVWPFVAITVLGSVSYFFMVRSRAGQEQRPRNSTQAGPFQSVGPRSNQSER